MNAIAALLVVTAFQGPISFGNGGLEDFILTEKQAYLVLPPQAVGASQTVFMSWSPSGRYLLMGQMRPQMTPALLSSVLRGDRPAKPAMAVSIWDKQQNRTTELGSMPDYYLVASNWLAGKDVMLDYVTEDLGEGKERASLLRIDVATAKLTYIPISNPIPEGTFYQLSVSPLLPRAVLLETNVIRQPGVPVQSKSAIWSVDEFGHMKSKLAMPAGSPHVGQWLQDGRALVFVHRRNAEGRVTQEKFVYDPMAGSIFAAPREVPPFTPIEGKSDLKVLMSQMLVPPGAVKRSHQSAWLKSAKQTEQGEYLLSPRADLAFLNSTTDAVAVLDQGVVTVRMLALVPKELYLQAKSAADKAKALSEVKQVGTGAQIFASDNDDRLPTQEEFLNGALQPYLKNNGLFDGFTYTFGGGSMADIKNPSGTMLGYKPVAGGFAVVFADGHAKRLSELPKNP